MASRFTLYGVFLSGPTYKVGLMLAFLQEPFDYVHINLREGEQKTPEFLAKNRFGQVPCLEDTQAGLRLSQSPAILWYLADARGKMGGASPSEQAETREWLFWTAERLAPFLYRRRAAALGFRPFDPVVLEKYKSEGDLGLAELNAHLTHRSWLVGEEATIADIDLYGVMIYATQGGFDLSLYPEVSAWMTRFEALPNFATPEALLPKQSVKTAA